ncbi:SpoIIE family protein phosphatase [Microvirga sp. GCM10011540]|uniref:SpoIIE family protein phosphatase n=1 Tax=Microvirga sp. GCM10011540 TaxID=3317338 RepID=UPI00360E3CFA
MKIRYILLTLTIFLGVALLVAVSVQIRTEILQHQAAQRMVASNAVREHLLLNANALAQERSRTVRLLVSGEADARHREELQEARARVDATQEAAEQEIVERSSDLRDPARSLASLSGVARDLDALRQQADAYLSAAPQDPGSEPVQRWFREATRLIDEVQSFRLTLLQQERPQDPALRAEAVLRTYGGVLSESIARNQAILTWALSRPGEINPAELEAVGRNVGRADLAWELIQSQLTAPLSPSVREAISAAHAKYDTTLSPVQQTLSNALQSQTRPAISAQEWYEIARQGLRSIANMQQELLRSSRDRLDLELAQSRRSVFLWSILLLCGFGAVLASALVVRLRVVRPLEALSSAMLRLAENDLSAPLPRQTRSDEIGEMSDALRVFKANAIRRQRSQQDKQMLHARLKDAYRQLRKDLEAAAVIQTTMLPPPSTLGDVRYCGLFRPSSLVAGDTYNVVRRSDGGIGFFQIDVAGHGAPAALVSVASHQILSQAILTRPDGMRLETLVERINADWPEGLPYFTMVVGEIDVGAQRAAIIQAGHPAPLLLRADGIVEPIGDGGFPVGMISSATYETLEFDFRPGDRLLVYSDGLVEAENREGEQFSEERLRGLVHEHAEGSTGILLDSLDRVLRKWRGSERLDDDLSVLMLERLSERANVDAHL